MYSANKFVPRIWLKSAGKWIGQLIFRPNGSDLPADSESGGSVNLYYHQEEYPNAIDLLRNEEPVYLLYNGTKAENGLLTSTEIVGEGELK